MTDSNEQRSFEVGDWVYRDASFAGKRGAKVARVTATGMSSGNKFAFSVDGTEPTYTNPHPRHRHATPEEIQAVPIAEGDVVNMRDHISGAFRASANTVATYESERERGGQHRDDWRHATPEEYREATAVPAMPVAAPLDDPPGLITDWMVTVGGALEVTGSTATAWDAAVYDAATVPDDWNTKQSDEDEDEALEDSHADERTLCPERVERVLVELAARIDTIECAASAKLIDAIAPTEAPPPAPPPLLYDRVTGAGPYIEVTESGDEDEEGYHYYYAGARRDDDDADAQACSRLWPQTLAQGDHRVEDAEPEAGALSRSEAALAELRQRARGELAAARTEARADGWEAGHRIGHSNGEVAGRAMASLAARKHRTRNRFGLLAAVLISLSLGWLGAVGVSAAWPDGYVMSWDVPSAPAPLAPYAGASKWVTIKGDSCDAESAIIVTEEEPEPTCERCTRATRFLTSSGTHWQWRGGHVWIPVLGRFYSGCAK